MRTIGVVSVGRSDVGLYRPILRQILSTQDLRMRLYVAGAHLSPHDKALADLEQEFPVFERIDMLLAADTPAGIAKSVGLGVIGFASAFARDPPDILLVLGDRFEMFAAVVAALPFRIPVAHVHGGELTAGAIDDAIRHSMTKLSHLHFASHKDYARRIVQLGEEPWRVTYSGAPALDDVVGAPRIPSEDLLRDLRLPPQTRPLIVTFHPETLRAAQTAFHVGEMLCAVEESGLPAVFTMPNVDTANSVVRAAIERHVARHPQTRAVESLGTQKYFSLMGIAAAMIGNSSSGILEAASFGLPVVNIGDRQEGRIRPANVIEAPHDRVAILDAIRRATSTSFRASCKSLTNPYATGKAAQIIVERLREIALDDHLLVKRFHDLPVTEAA